MSDSAVQRFYRYHAYVYDSTRWMILHGRRRAVETLAVQPNSEILEIGCGTGLNFRFVQERLDPSAGKLVGLDFSEDMLERASRRVESQNWRNVELMRADASTLQLARRFDGILFAYSITMIPDWRGALRRAFEHLKPDGRMTVLDFGQFRGWGPLAPVMRGWLRANHVETLQPYIETLREIDPKLQVIDWMGGYNFTAVVRRGDAVSVH
ncbi:MAG: class I SAM-dependent methyltransferase [Phycisphaerales bacterium]|nr:class I SAM-dependent methyltransferase [Phycisphaerales bacterium]